MSPSVAAQTLQRLLPREHGRLIAALARTTGGDLQLAEDALQQAALAALEQWEQPPPQPLAWLLKTARFKAIDQLRRQGTWSKKAALLKHSPAPAPSMDHQIPDTRLRLICTCCHPALALQAQIALTLKVVAGLSSEEVARAFLVDRVTMQQRLVRAKRKIKLAGIPYEIPGPEQLPERLSAILRVIYLVFTEGWAATEGQELVRHALCQQGISLGMTLRALLPHEPEVHGLLSLMLLQDARRPARLDHQGLPILLAHQDRSLWDGQRIHLGMLAMRRAGELGRPGPYTLQAAIASVHARAERYCETDWQQIVALYELLMACAPGPVVELNRAAAVYQLSGAQAGLRALTPLLESPYLKRGHLLFATHAAMLADAGQGGQAARALRLALERVGNSPERRWLEGRLVELEGS